MEGIKRRSLTVNSAGGIKWKSFYAGRDEDSREALLPGYSFKHPPFTLAYLVHLVDVSLGLQQALYVALQALIGRLMQRSRDFLFNKI